MCNKHPLSIIFLSVVCCVAPWTAQTHAQPASFGTDLLDAAERQAVVDDVARLLNELYIFPEVAKQSGDRIIQELKDGAFDDITDPKEFAARLTESLFSVSQDKHMYVSLRSVPESAEKTEAFPESDSDFFNRQWREKNFGFQRVERLEGNVGYLELRMFFDPGLARDAAIAAMDLLSGSDAIIIDIRQNPGGTPDMVQLLCSYFFDGQVQINSTYGRGGEKFDELWTLKYVSGRRMPEVPVYILTGPKTGSAAEAFAYHLQSMGRVTVVGEQSAGAGMRGVMRRVGERFRMQISRLQVLNTVSGKGFEGVGVIPDIPSKVDDALEVALDKAKEDARVRQEQNAIEARALRQRLGPLLEKGESLLDEGKYEEAASVYKEVLGYNPQGAWEWYTLGNCYLRMGSETYSEAIEAYQRATKFSETKLYAYYSIACLRALREETDEALDALEACIRVGFAGFDMIKGDPDLEILRDHPRYLELVAR